MNFTVGTLLALSFLISAPGLSIFPSAPVKDLMRTGRDATDI
jgi:hypothetical protein